MGQFKPMVKMETTEPSVELKLKKGGHVAGHSAMKSTMPMEMADNRFAAPGKAPKKPSIMERRKSMKAPMLMSKKGGMAKKADGGMIKSSYADGGAVDRPVYAHAFDRPVYAHAFDNGSGMARGGRVKGHGLADLALSRMV